MCEQVQAGTLSFCSYGDTEAVSAIKPIECRIMLHVCSTTEAAVPVQLKRDRNVAPTDLLLLRGPSRISSVEDGEELTNKASNLGMHAYCF